MEIDLNKHNGAQDRTPATIWQHTVNADQQRWYLKNVGIYGSGTQSYLTQVPVPYAAADGGSFTSFASRDTPYPPPFIPNCPVQV